MAGAGFKTFNTGDVLTASDVNTYLMQQTVMVFADSSARSTALGANVAEGMISYLKDTNAVEVYNGSAWVSSDDPNAIQNTIVDAKGDLISATAADTPARLAVGTNGQVLTADSTESTGLKWATPAAGGFFKNPVLNSNFSVWQRGTSIAGSSTAYAADRWQSYRTVAGSTYSRQVTGDTTNLPNIQYCMRVQRDSGNSSTTALYLAQSFETVNSIPFVGKTVTLSFYARAGANYSAGSNALTYRTTFGTGTDQNVLTSYTGANNFISGTATLTTTWQRFSASATVGTTANELGIYFQFDPTGTAGAADYFEITGVQIEVGSTATDYYPNGNTYQAELAACQRYYYQMVSGDAKSIGTGAYLAATEVYCGVFFPVTMRTAPTLSATSGTNYYVSAVNNGSDFLNSLTADRISTNTSWLLNSSEASSTIGYASILRTANASASIAFSAEL